MFRSSTILRELVQSLVKVIFLLKHLVKLRLCILCGDVATCRGMVCVLFVVQTEKQNVVQLLIFELPKFVVVQEIV
jgi:hypothetical protein